MKSLEKLTKLANRFERKLSLADAPKPQINEGGNPQVIRDAFFGSSTGSGGKSQEEFTQRWIYRPESAFQAALQSVPANAKFNIGVSVDAPKGVAGFTGAPKALTDALAQDYIAYYQSKPIDRVKAINPQLVGQAPGVVQVT